MPVPTIDPESSVLSYPQWLTWEHQFSATNAPSSWTVASGSWPTGMIFEGATDVTGTASTDLIEAVAHGFLDNMVVLFTTITGGSGLTALTRYYVVNANADDFQLSLTEGGTPALFTTDITAGKVIRPGHLTGAATVPGISNVRLTATNGTGASAEVLFTIGIEPAAASPDANTDLVWDIGTGGIFLQTSSALNLTPPAAGVPVMTVKEGDDFLARLRIIKGGTVIAPVASNLRLAVKELEPEAEVVISTEWEQIGTGTGTSYLVYGAFDGTLLAASLANYEADAGTRYEGLAEFELTYANPYAIGPVSLVKSSLTFLLRIERDIAS